MKLFARKEKQEVFFENVFPEPKEVFRKNHDATLLDFLTDPEAYFIVNRREWMTYDLLIQPDVREMVKIAGWGAGIYPAVNLKRKEAEALRATCLANFYKALPDMEKHLGDKEMQEIARAIYWGNGAILRRNPKAYIRFFDPVYLPSRQGLFGKTERTFQKLI